MKTLVVVFVSIISNSISTVESFATMMSSFKGNLYADIPAGDKVYPGEIFHRILESKSSGPSHGLHIDRIISTGQTTEYSSQDEDEWVILLKGSAKISFQTLVGGSETITIMDAGDYLLIPKGTRHRVSETSKVPGALWLAVHSTGLNGLILRETGEGSTNIKHLLGELVIFTLATNLTLIKP